MHINLLDLECFLINKRTFEIEINGEMNNISSDELWEIIHKQEIKKAELFTEDIIYILLNGNTELMLFIEEYKKIA